MVLCDKKKKRGKAALGPFAEVMEVGVEMENKTKPRRLKVRARDRKGANQLSKQGVIKAVRTP